MNRYDFLKSIGFRGAALMAVMTSCVSEEDTFIEAAVYDPNKKVVTGTGNSINVSTPELLVIKNQLLNLKLSDATNASLLKIGGYIRKSNIVVAQVSENSFAAVTQLCTHEPKKDVIFNKNEFYCTAHGAKFTLAGKGLNDTGRKGIQAYKVYTDGISLVVTA